MDTLLRPCADIGIEAESLIEWRYDIDKQIDHIVLGKGPPGGAWHTFPGAVRSLSPGNWLALPPHVGVGVGGGVGIRGRVPARAVAAYCRRYVHACKLQKYFRNGVTVTHVTRMPPCRTCNPHTNPANPTFLIHARDVTGHTTHYVCKRLVLAIGVGDRPNMLKLQSPMLNNDMLARDLLVTERGIHVLGKCRLENGVVGNGLIGNGVVGNGEIGNGVIESKEMGNGDESGARTVMVVGSGVSAADAVRLARGVGLNVIHVHRAAADSLAKLSPVTYPEYCQVYKMMLDGPSGNHQNYTPYPEHAVLDITPAPQNTPTHRNNDLLTLKTVKLLNLRSNQTVEVTVSLIAVLIGSKPDLFFLQSNFETNLDIHTNLDTTLNTQCIKCIKKQEEDQKQCFIKNHWHYIKNVLEQSIQICKSKYLNYEINGNEKECIMGEFGGFEGDGVGWGVEMGKAVDGRGNPLAVYGGSHEARKVEGVYALGPLTADNFMRFIPGGAVAIVSHIHKQRDN